MAMKFADPGKRASTKKVGGVGTAGGALSNLNNIIGNINTNFKVPSFNVQSYLPAAPAAAPAQQSWGQAPYAGGNYNGGGFNGGVGTGGNAGVYNPPAPARETYSMNDSNERIAQVDGTFRDQESDYNKALKLFLADIGRRKETLSKDTDQAREGISRNRELGLTGMGEDFAARGLGNSGLWMDAHKKGADAYTRQDTSVVDAKTTGEAELNFSGSKEEADNASRIQAAKRDALYRLSLNNNLVTGL